MKANKKNKKSGFTLVELMVVAIIVAILAAVAIPLMSGNTERAMATEGKTGCGAVATAVRMHYVENGAAATAPKLADLKGITAADLKGTYFETYEVDASGPNDYTITATGKGKAAGKTVEMKVEGGATTWSGLGED